MGEKPLGHFICKHCGDIIEKGNCCGVCKIKIQKIKEDTEKQAQFMKDMGFIDNRSSYRIYLAMKNMF